MSIFSQIKQTDIIIINFTPSKQDPKVIKSIVVTVPTVAKDYATFVKGKLTESNIIVENFDFVQGDKVCKFQEMNFKIGEAYTAIPTETLAPNNAPRKNDVVDDFKEVVNAIVLYVPNEDAHLERLNRIIRLLLYFAQSVRTGDKVIQCVPLVTIIKNMLAKLPEKHEKNNPMVTPASTILNITHEPGLTNVVNREDTGNTAESAVQA